MSTAPGSYVPTPEGLNVDFHRRAVETGRLHVQRCAASGVLRHPPRWYCAACASPDWELVPSSERGTVHSYTVTHLTFDPAWAAEAPFATLVVELDEGPRVVAAARGMAPDEVSIGRRVRVTVEPRGEEFAFRWAEPEDTTP
jgi:uncharacterized OB-fold protein